MTYDAYEQSYQRIAAANPLEKDYVKKSDDELEDSDLELLESGENKELEGEDGVLFFPTLYNKAYSVRPISQSSLMRYMKTAMGASDSIVKDTKIVQKPSPLVARFVSTIEVVVAKLFLAGFMWQSCATLSGASSDTFWYALVAGVGEATGVFFGNLFYDVFKKTFIDDSVDAVASLHTSVLLATATVCSGTAWQPTVNLLRNNLGLPFYGVFWGTWIGCTYCFNFGLRIARNLFSVKLTYVEGPTWENSRTDFSLSITIGAATAFFVGTDAVNYTPEENFLYHVVGTTDAMSPMEGAFRAGCSTALGFVVAQTVFNLVYPYGTCWID